MSSIKTIVNGLLNTIMADISEIDMQLLLADLGVAAGSLAKLANNMDNSSGGSGRGRGRSKSNDNNEFRTKNTKGLKDHYEALKDAATSTHGFERMITSATEHLGEFTIGVEILKDIWNYGTKTIKTYQELTDVGETFGGSMLEMSRMAALAGMPLDLFAKTVKKNNVIVKQMGVGADGQGGFFKLNKQLRDITSQYGNYGLSLEELANFQGDYLEMQRKAGLDPKTQSASIMADFLGNVSAAADALGTSREAIIKQTAELMSDPLASAEQRENLASGMQGYNDKMKDAIAWLAAQPGQAGKALSEGMLQTFSTTGGAIFSKLGKELIQSGQGGLTSLLDEYNQKIRAGADPAWAMNDMVRKFDKTLNDPATLESLRNLASHGNEGARAILAFSTEMKPLTDAQVKQAEIDSKNAKVLTAFWENISNILNQLRKSFVSGFLKAFEGSDKKLTGFTEKLKTTADELGKFLGKFGESIGNFVTSFLTPENIKATMDGIYDVFKFVWGTAKVLKAVIDFLAPPLGFLGKMLFGLLETVHTVTLFLGSLGEKVIDFFTGGIFHKNLDAINKVFAGIITAGTALAIWFGAKQIWKSLFGKMFTPEMTVRAGIVNVIGGSGGGIGDGLGGGGGGGGKGRAGKAAQELEEYEKAGGKSARKLKALKKAAQLEEDAVKAAGMAAKEGGFLTKFGKFFSKFGFIGKIASFFAGMEMLAPLFGGIGKVTGKIRSVAGKTIDGIGSVAGKLMEGGKTATGKLLEGGKDLVSKLPGAKMLGSAAAKVAPKFAGSALGRLGGAFIPGVGAVVDTMASADAFKKGNGLAGSLYGLGAGVNGVGAVLDSTVIGAAAGGPLDIIGGLLSGAGLAADVTGFGKGIDMGDIMTGALGATGIGAPMAAMLALNKHKGVPARAGKTQQPVTLDPLGVATIENNALGGDPEAQRLWKQIKEALDHNTAVLAKTQNMSIQATRDGTRATKKIDGSFI